MTDFLCPYCGSWHNKEIEICPTGKKKIEQSMKYLGRNIKGKYNVVRVIGEGGMGTVYEVKHLSLEKKFAMKLLHPALSKDQETLIRFKREAKAAAQLGHGNIVTVTDIDEDEEGTPFMIMELLEGENLCDRLIRQKKLPIKEGIDIMLQVLVALNETHSKGIIHRDLKPENIFLVKFGGRDDWVKILDFGLVKFKETPQGTSLTKKGMILGTPFYMAPEQFQKGALIDGRTDLYACGVILYRIFTGKLPFESPTIPGLIYAILNNDPIHPCDIQPDIPRQLGDIIVKSMAKKIDERFQNALEMAKIIAPFSSGTLSGIQNYIQTNVEIPSERKIDSSVLAPDSSIIIRRIFSPRRAILFSLLFLFSTFIIGGGIYFFLQKKGNDRVKEVSSHVTTMNLINIRKHLLENMGESSEIEMIPLSISVLPEKASIFFDGMDVNQNPYMAFMKKDGSEHVIEAKMEGYENYFEKVKLDREIKREIVLKKVSNHPLKGKIPKKLEEKRTKFIETNPYKNK